MLHNEQANFTCPLCSTNSHTAPLRVNYSVASIFRSAW